MKHLSTLRKLLLMLCVMLGGANVWGETGTITFGTNNTNIDKASVTANDDLGNRWTITTVGTTSFTPQPTYYQVGSSKKPATSITFTATLPSEVNVTSFSAKFGGFSGTAGTINLKVGDTEVGSGSLNAANDVAVNNTTAAVGNTLTITVTGIAKGVKVYNISYTYEAAAGSGPAAPTFSLAAGTYYKAQTLEITTMVENGTIYYTTDETDPTTSDTRETYSSALAISETTTINACVEDSEGNYSDVVTRTYTIAPSIANTQGTAYTTAEAIDLIEKTSPEQLGDEKVYVKGTISEVGTFSSGYITYWLDGNKFQVYKGKGLGNADFSAKTDIKVDAQVIVYGNLKKFSETYELDQNNYLVEYTAPAAKPIKSVEITGAASKTTYEKGETFNRSGLTLTVTYEDDTILDVTSDATWTVTPETLNEIGITQVTVTATYEGYTPSKSIEVTVTAPQPAALPFSFDDGKSAISTTQGMDQTGLGSDYDNSPKLKFDGSNDELVIYYDGPASYLGHTIKGNSFSGGTFSVMESVDGVNYTNVATYTTLSASATACMNVLKSASRYVKFVYTEKSKGNVALGAIEISADKTPITISAAGYATYYNSAKACTLPAGCKGYVFYKGKLQNMYNGLDPVPANEPLVIKAVEDTHVLNFTTTGEKSLKSKGKNDLEGTDEETVLPADDTYYFYGLSLNSEGDLNSVGFYWMNEDGVAFTNGAHKAYLKLAKNKVAGIKAFVFGDEETAIESVEAETANEEIFDLSGRKVSKAVKGLYIINGKKVVK
ncbi:MAG: chitobiase/beta-hexosaminidase C-terminal domain-containing protein [Bacteroidaceae bacterium]